MISDDTDFCPDCGKSTPKSDITYPADKHTSDIYGNDKGFFRGCLMIVGIIVVGFILIISLCI